MSDMPERIWAEREDRRPYSEDRRWQPISVTGGTEYIRVDAVVAKLRAEADRTLPGGNVQNRCCRRVLDSLIRELEGGSDG